VYDEERVLCMTSANGNIKHISTHKPSPFKCKNNHQDLRVPSDTKESKIHDEDTEIENLSAPNAIFARPNCILGGEANKTHTICHGPDINADRD